MSLSMQQKRGTASEWLSANAPILLAGEIGFEIDTKKIKIGDGSSNWSTLEYVLGSGGGIIIDELLSAGNNDVGTLGSIDNATTIDTIVASEWRSLKYVITMAKTAGGTNNFASTELTILIDSTNVSVCEYGAIDNNGEVGTVSVSQSGGNINVIVTPNLLVKPITVRYYRTGLKA